MADRDIDLHITANDDASKVIDKVADEIAALDDTTTIEIDADTDQAETRIERFGRELDGLTDTAREIRITFKEGQLERELQGTLKALEKLDDPVAIQIRQDDLESTLRDIEQLRELAGRDIEFKVNVDDDVATSIDKIGEKGRAASTAIGGIGNQISELPGVGALGPMAESMGQLAEGALEGEIRIGQLIGTAGGLAAVAYVAQGVAKHFDQIAQSKAWRREQVDGYVDALDEADSVLDGIVQKLRDDEGIFADFGGGLGRIDVTTGLANAGVSVEQFAILVEGGTEKIDAWAEAMREAGVDGDTVSAVVLAATQQTDALAKSQENAAVMAKVFGDEQGRTNDEIERASTKVGVYDSGLKQAAAATDDLRRANEQLRGDLDNRAAYLNILGDLDQLETAGAAAWEANRVGASDAAAKTRDAELAQIDLKNAVSDYVAEVGNVPPEVVSDIYADIDDWSLADAKAKLDDLEKDRRTNLFVDLIGGKTLSSIPIPRYVAAPTSAPTASNDVAGRSAQSDMVAVSNVTNIVNLPRAADPRDIDSALTRWNRTNGPTDG